MGGHARDIGAAGACKENRFGEGCPSLFSEYMQLTGESLAGFDTVLTAVSEDNTVLDQGVGWRYSAA